MARYKGIRRGLPHTLHEANLVSNDYPHGASVVHNRCRYHRDHTGISRKL